MLQLIGLGLADETDVTIKGLELIKKAERVYLEAYTSILLVDTAKLVSAHQPISLAKSYSMHLNSRKPIMAAPSLSPIEKWSSPRVTRS